MTAPHAQHVKAVDSPEKSDIKKTFRAVKGLSPSEKRTALEIIKQREKQGKLDPRWTANLMKVLTAIKEEELHFKAKAK